MKTPKMNGNSFNPQEELLELLRKNFPEIFAEGRVNCEKLKKSLGENLDENGERYGLSWAGKTDCFRQIQESTTATLKPNRGESVDFDTTKNLFIEGDNLQVLRILQKSYYGKVKMIYIDPPYNTGNDSFIYPDKFQESREDYLERVGERDEEGNLMQDGMFQRNSKENGHYHSNWLSMMYPRLFLARNLLKQDGVIFVSIDDHEVHNLRMIMNEIFGEENFEAHIHWRRRHNQPNDKTKMVGLVAEHVLVFAKNSPYLKKVGVGKLELTGEFSNPDNDPRGDWNSKPWKVGENQNGSKYKITLPNNEVVNGEWMGDENNYKKLLEDGRIYFPRSGAGFPRKKIFKHERLEEGQCATNWFKHSLFGHNQEATNECADLFDGNKKIFDNPKPTKIIKQLALIANTANNDLVLDFFAGSGTTAHAVMALNAEDGGNRKCISVQLPELCDENSEAAKAGFKTIADIAKERIRRAGKKIAEEKNGKLDFEKQKLDIGFKVFKLDESNFKIWRSDISTVEELEKQMDLFVDNVRQESTQENILHELILKSGLDLNVPVAKKEADKKQYFVLGEGELIICLEDKISKKLVDKILAEKPKKVVCLDRAFGGNDQLKTNTILQAGDEGVEFKVI